MFSTVEQLTAAYELEKQNRRPPVSAEDVPFAYEDITPEWLTRVLCARHPGAAVTGYRLDDRDEGTTNRRRIFIDYNAAGKSAGLPARVFCKATQGLRNRLTLGLMGLVHAEVNYQNKVRPLLDIEAPVCRFAHFNSALNSIIIMDDLGADTQFCTHTTDITRERAENQMRVLAAIHGRFLDNPALAPVMSIFNTYADFFRMLDAFPNIEKASDDALDIAGDAIPHRLLTRRKEIWPATRKAAALHLQLPQTLCHGDVHLRNWYIASNGHMGVTDWQTSRGHWSRDVIYALTTSLTIENRRSWEQELLRYYHDQLQQVAGRRIPFDGFFDECRRQLFSVLSSWTPTLNPTPDMPDMQPRDATLEFVRRIATAIDDLDALDSFDT